jgi:hypothetical protein
MTYTEIVKLDGSHRPHSISKIVCSSVFKSKTADLGNCTVFKTTNS